MDNQHGNNKNQPHNYSLFKLAADGDAEAREKIILDYFPLVKSCVKQFIGKGVPYDDLFQEGCYGLILAVDRFDPERKVAFSSFAKNYILKYIRKASIQQKEGSALRCNEDLYYEVMSLLDAHKRFCAEFDKSPTDKELADYMGIKVKKVSTLKSVAAALSSTQMSLDDPNTNFYLSRTALESRPLEAEFLPQTTPSDLCKELTKREDEVLRRRLGYNSSNCCETWDEISAATGLCVSTLYKAYNSGLEKIRKLYFANL